MRGEEEAEKQDQRGGDEQLRGQAAQTVVVNLSASGAAGRAASLDDRTGTLCADQMLAAHLDVPSGCGAPVHLARSGGLAARFPLDCSLAKPGYP